MRKIFIVFIFLLLSGQIISQTYTQENVRNPEKSYLMPIYQDKEVTGYFSYAFTKNQGLNDALYTLTILDENLNVLSEKEYLESKNIKILGLVANDNAILIKQFDSKKRSVVHKYLSPQGNIISEQRRQMSRMNYEYDYLVALANGSITLTSAFSGGNNGFVDITQPAQREWIITGLDNRGNEKWKYPVKSEDDYSFPSVMGASDLLTILITTKREKGDRNDSYELLALDAQGKKVFSQDLKITDKSLHPHSIEFSEDGREVYLLGEYFRKNANTQRSETMGLFLMTFYDDASKPNIKFVDWKNQVAPLYPKKKALIEYSLMFHHLQKLSDGRFIAVAEEYKNQASAAGIAKQILSLSFGTINVFSPIELVIGDINVFTFSRDLELIEVEVFEKRKSSPQNTDVIGDRHSMANYFKQQGYFGFKFYQVDQERDNFMFTYYETGPSLYSKLSSIRSVNYHVGSPQSSASRLHENIYKDNAFLLPGADRAILHVKYIYKHNHFVMRKEDMSMKTDEATE